MSKRCSRDDADFNFCVVDFAFYVGNPANQSGGFPPPRRTDAPGTPATRMLVLAVGPVVASWSGVPGLASRSTVASQAQLDMGRWAPRANSNRDAGTLVLATGSRPLQDATFGGSRRAAIRRAEPKMMAEEDNLVQSLLIKGAALVVIYFILAQILPTPPPRV